MGWLQRLRQGTTGQTSEARNRTKPALVEWTSPGLGALFDALRDERDRSLLDLSHAGDSQLRVLGRFSRQIRFAGLVPAPPRGEQLAAALGALPPNAERPYDVVLAWDVLDRLSSDDRARLVERLVELTAPSAWLYAVVDASGAKEASPLRMTLVDLDRVSQVELGPREPLAPQLLPAHVERLLRPFVIVHAFTLRAGRREYVARKSDH